MKRYKFVTSNLLGLDASVLFQRPYTVFTTTPAMIVWPLSTRNISFQSKFHYGELSFPFHQLTTLEIYSELDATFITIKEFFSILTKGPNLEDLRIHCIGIEVEFPDPNSSDTENLVDLSHQRLRSLHIAVVDDGYIIDPLVQHALFPSLKCLVIGSPTRKRPWTHAALAGFLDRTADIRELEVICREIGWSEVAQYFVHTPNASRVSVRADRLGDYELNLLASDILPHLEHLTLEGEIGVSSGAFTEFLRQRCRARGQRDEVVSLRSLDIRCLGKSTAFADVTVAEKLKQYCETGTNIKIEMGLPYRVMFLSRRFH